MAVVTISRWASSDASLAKELGAVIKKHGAISVQLGICHAGAYAGRSFWIIVFPDFETYGRAIQGLTADADYQKIYGELAMKFQLQERSIISVEDL